MVLKIGGLDDQETNMTGLSHIKKKIRKDFEKWCEANSDYHEVDGEDELCLPLISETKKFINSAILTAIKDFKKQTRVEKEDMNLDMINNGFIALKEKLSKEEEYLKT